MRRHPVTVSGMTPHSASPTPIKLRHPMAANAMAAGNRWKKESADETVEDDDDDDDEDELDDAEEEVNFK